MPDISGYNLKLLFFLFIQAEIDYYEEKQWISFVGIKMGVYKKLIMMPIKCLSFIQIFSGYLGKNILDTQILNLRFQSFLR